MRVVGNSTKWEDGWEVVLHSLMLGPSPGAKARGDHTMGGRYPGQGRDHIHMYNISYSCFHLLFTSVQTLFRPSGHRQLPPPGRPRWHVAWLCRTSETGRKRRRQADFVGFGAMQAIYAQFTCNLDPFG